MIDLEECLATALLNAVECKVISIEYADKILRRPDIFLTNILQQIIVRDYYGSDHWVNKKLEERTRAANRPSKTGT